MANQAKFLVLFKRPGKPVLLGRRGDLIVRPSTIEHTAHRTSGTSLKQHMLFGSYCPSLAQVLCTQVAAGGKAMPGGREALQGLGEEAAMDEVLRQMLGLGSDGADATTSDAAAEAAASQAADQLPTRDIADIC